MTAAPHDVPALSDFNRVAEVARYLTVSPDTIYRLVQSAALASVRIGSGRGGIRIRRDDVAAFLAQNTHRVTNTHEVAP